MPLSQNGGTFPGRTTFPTGRSAAPTVDGWVIGLAYVDTNRHSFGTAAATNKDISGPTGVLWVSKTF